MRLLSLKVCADFCVFFRSVLLLLLLSWLYCPCSTLTSFQVPSHLIRFRHVAP